MSAPEACIESRTYRVSTDKQDVARQEFDIEDNRERHGYTVLRQIRIKISGTKVMTHEDVQGMVAALALPSVDGVSVSSIDRLFRPEDFSFLLLQEFHKLETTTSNTLKTYYRRIDRSKPAVESLTGKRHS